MLNNPIIAALLVKRGISEEEMPHFISPDFVADQHDASLMKGMDVVIQRLVKAKNQQERVIIFGDYDADGVPATALLMRTLSRAGLVVEPVIPSRAQGYGLSEEIVADLITKNAPLIITVDNGTVAKEEIAQLVAAGSDVIVIDHHEPQEGEVADMALAIINPKQAECPYPFKELCACGLAWKVVDQLYAALALERGELKWELDLVGLSTIADMVPLIGENRLFALYGLKVFAKTRNLGLKALAESAGVTLADVSAGDVGFKIAPRINAPSRMHKEMVQGQNAAIQLLITNDKVQAAQLANYLGEQNTARQGLVDEHIVEAEQQVLEMLDSLVLVVYNDTWSTGVIGLVASRLLEKYKRPVIALAPEEGVIKGSVRSVDGLHAIELLESAKEQLARFGGHAKAAGLTLNGDVALFRAQVNVHAQDGKHTLQTLSVAAERNADSVLQLDDVTLELCDALDELQPYGIGFARPLFETICRVQSIRQVGNAGQHLSLFLVDGEAKKKAIGFRLGDTPVNEHDVYCVRYTIEQETWREVTSPICHIQSIRPATEAELVQAGIV